MLSFLSRHFFSLYFCPTCRVPTPPFLIVMIEIEISTLVVYPMRWRSVNWVLIKTAFTNDPCFYHNVASKDHFREPQAVQNSCHMCPRAWAAGCDTNIRHQRAPDRVKAPSGGAGAQLTSPRLPAFHFNGLCYDRLSTRAFWS